ncbi:poly-beta-1,6 N-acetyl-D-glucosamine synthase [Candidatus Methylospira mobilis]|uniref:Poly-beta-1,6-N-acetyl-D-glucosamine synthase n=1 Tax=Candidatus Methylospira mobilis TaxID=1808979 RepID=A0A5Q0BP69_9GAMM|nr:poly-beta-1,6-N-acetyl-D-glucosamine synthase [Candidatus Methylospira mobilis]QFY43888.1 poly-beta-1,6 N-acetyl-D-glucosamine synthase [Candidatus Methylospira mobilis]
MSTVSGNLSDLLHVPRQLISTNELLTVLWRGLSDLVCDYVFYYPLVMAHVWMLGAILYYLAWERKEGDTVDDMPVMRAPAPGVSILVPCYNEADNIQETIEFLLQQRYPNFEILAINDGSRDETLSILNDLAKKRKELRVVNLASNQGKAMALQAGALLSRHEFLVCIDGDALLAPEAVSWMVRHFLKNPRVGAVTGNPRIRTRSTLLGKIQVGEFSAIVGLIKRAQRFYGRLFTVSGVIAAFRKSALHSVGYWSNDMVTEDIDISWKLQLKGWDIRFETNALCWVLMPETLRGLWKQRLRWSQGGAEVLLRYSRDILRWSARRMWPIYLECLLSILWSYLMVFVLSGWIVNQFVHPHYNIAELIPDWPGMLLSMTCLAQFAVSLAIDSRYEARIGGVSRYYYWMIWYPLVYWLNNVGTTVVGFMRALAKERGQRALWVTVDRGLGKK